MKTIKTIQSVERALNILEEFNVKEKEIGVTELAKRLSLNKSTCFGLLQTLESRGYLEQNTDNGKYRLGLNVFKIGQIYEANLELLEIARPYLEELVEKTKETAHLVIRNKLDAVYIEKCEGPCAINIISRVGKRVNLHCTGVGKALLAYLSEKEFEDVVKKEPNSFTPKTIIDKEELKRHLQTVRENGYSIDDEEIEIGLRCIAAPVFNHKNQAIAAISISGPSTRITYEKFPELIEIIKHTAYQVSLRMGYNSY